MADACSGLRSLIALLALGVLMAYLSKLSLWKKIVLVITAIPVAVVTNIIRLIIIVLLADRFGIGIVRVFCICFPELSYSFWDFTASRCPCFLNQDRVKRSKED